MFKRLVKAAFGTFGLAAMRISTYQAAIRLQEDLRATQGVLHATQAALEASQAATAAGQTALSTNQQALATIIRESGEFRAGTHAVQVELDMYKKTFDHCQRNMQGYRKAFQRAQQELDRYRSSYETIRHDLEEARKALEQRITVATFMS